MRLSGATLLARTYRSGMSAQSSRTRRPIHARSRWKRSPPNSSSSNLMGACHAGSVRPTGTLHVSLPSDIVQLFGTGSVPAIVAGSVLGVFELGERLTSQQAKDNLSKRLLTFNVQKVRALPDGTQELFEKIFGERHFSLKCFVRSAAFSLGAIALISMLCLLISPQVFLSNIFITLALPLWLMWSIVVDYISL